MELRTDWPIHEPTTNRLEVDYYPADALRETDVEGQRLVLLGLSDGNNLFIVAVPDDQWERARVEILPARAAHARFGTWRRYRTDLATARRIIGELGFHLSRRERRILQALEAYQPPCRPASLPGQPA